MAMLASVTATLISTVHVQSVLVQWSYIYLPQVPSSLLSAQVLWLTHWLLWGLHRPFAHNTSPGLQDATCFTHVHTGTYKQERKKNSTNLSLAQSHVFNIKFIVNIWTFTTIRRQRNATSSKCYLDLTAFSLIPSVRTILNSITHLPQRNTTSISTAKLTRTGWRHTATKCIHLV